MTQRRDLGFVLGGGAMAAALGIACTGGEVLAGEEAVLGALNGLPAVVGWPMRAVMQLGDAKLVPAIALIVYAAWRRWPLSGAVAAAGLSAWFLANRVKEVVDRPRPAALLDEVVLREDTHGRGFPSGHSAVAAALAVVIAPHIPPRWRWMAYVVPVVVAAARVHVGVHLPLDGVGGLGLGAAVGGAALLAFGRRLAVRP